MPLHDTFAVDGNHLTRHAVPARRMGDDGKPYKHRCYIDTSETVCHAIDEAGEDGTSGEQIIEAEDLPYTQVFTAIAFLRERGCVEGCYPRRLRAIGSCHLDGMTEWHALEHEGKQQSA